MVKWGIIGCGNVCEVKSGPAFYKCNNSSLVAVMRRDREKAIDYAIRHNVSKYYSHVEELINDPEIDIIYVATPPESHEALAIQVMKAGKPVYVEKPMAATYQQCKNMLLAAEKYNQKIFVAYYRRALPYFLKIKELIVNKAIGKLQIVKGEFFRPPYPTDLNSCTHTWRLNKKIAGGGYFYDVASHTIDILMFLLGNINKANGIRGNTAGFYEVEDTVSASFLFESGVIGTGIWSYVSSEEERKDTITIIGDKGSITFSTFAFTDIILKGKNQIEKFNFPRPEHIQMYLIQSIINEIEGNGISPSNGKTASETNRIMEEIFKNK